MNYPIPASPQEIVALQENPVNEELIAAAIAGVIKVAHSQGQSLEEITAQVLAEDSLLDQATRRWLSEVVAQAWSNFEQEPSNELEWVGVEA
jgi:hypothetical protein